MIAVHLKGHFAPTRHAAAYWREQSKAGEEVRGRVINTSSPSGVFGNVGQANYGAAKAGIAALTMIAAQELGRYGVTVNCLAPNARTRMTEEAFGEMPAPAEGFDAMDPANNSPIVVALCADEAQDITGQVLLRLRRRRQRPAPLGRRASSSPATRAGTPTSCSRSCASASPTGSRRPGWSPMMAKAGGQSLAGD